MSKDVSHFDPGTGEFLGTGPGSAVMAQPCAVKAPTITDATLELGLQSDLAISGACDQLFAALAAAQGEMEPVKNDGTNPFFKRGGKDSTYATLNSVLSVAREPLSKHGLALVQLPTNAGSEVCVTTMLTHKSGQWLRSRVQAKPAKADAQGIGSVVTYLRRYSALAVLGLAGADDDGNAASGHGLATDNRVAPPPANVTTGRTVAPRVDSQEADMDGVARTMWKVLGEAQSLEALDAITHDEKFVADMERLREWKFEVARKMDGRIQDCILHLTQAVAA